MLINGKRSNIIKEDLLQSAHSMRIKENRALEIIDDANNALLKWKGFAEEAHLEKETIEMIQKTFVLY